MPEPTWERDGIRLYLGDCLDILPTLEAGSVDAVVTDPVWPNTPSGMFLDTMSPVNLLHTALESVEAKRVVVILRMDSDPRFLVAVPNRWWFQRVQMLPYAVPGFIGRNLGGLEVAYGFGEPIRFAPGRQLLPGWSPPAQPQPKNGHPCSRAIEHMRWLVNWWSDENETVLDPFMGAGTTGLACISVGRRFIGIECDTEYFAIAIKRIEAAMQQMRLPLELEVRR